MPSTTEEERRRLLTSEPVIDATSLAGNVQGVAHEIQQAMKEEAPGSSFFDLLRQRPLSVSIAFALLFLFMLVSTSFPALKNPQALQNLLQVPQIVPVDLDLAQISAHEIDVVTKFNFTMDYNQLGSGIVARLAEQVAENIGSVNLGVEGPVLLSVLVDEDASAVWKHVIQVDTAETFHIALSSNQSQSISVRSKLSDVGQTAALEYIVQRLLANDFVRFQARGILVVGKFGFSARLPFDLETSFRLPEQTSEEMADLARIDVDTTESRSLNATALLNVTVGDLPFTGEFPEMRWQVKIPGCDPMDHVVFCQGESHPFALLGSDSVLDVFFSAIVDQLPPALINPCNPGNPNSVSALDRWISKFIAGDLSTFYVEGMRHPLQPAILNELFAGYDIPYSVYGKSPTEKLIKSLSLDEVRFGSASLGPAESARFSGKATVDILLPSFLTLTPSARASVAVESVMGNIQLFDTMKRHIGQIKATEQWISTVSLAHSGGYTVVCKFDNVPTEISDRQAFAETSRELLMRGEVVVLYDAVVNLKILTSAGSLVIKKVRIRGETEMRK